jgi:citrate lyase subunit beta/citryl-CoA lyase
MPVVTPRFVDKAWTRGCDFIVLDLEDSVPQHLKAHARSLIREAIPNVSKGGAEAFTRINHDTMEADVEGVVWPGLKRIKYPKTEHASEVKKLDALITRYERERGVEPGTVEIDASIETAVGVTNVFDIAAASPRIREFGATTGGYDLSRDLGIEMFVDFDQFVYPRGEAELAARALGLGVRTAPFVANTTGSVSDGERALRQAEAARKCGLRLGGGGLNPAVVDAHNVGFTPTADEIREAKAVLEDYERLEGTSDTWIEIEGRVIDRYEAERARELLDWANLCAERDREKREAVERAC